MKTHVLVILLALQTHICAFNILGVLPHLGKSHADVFIALMKGLAQKGHNVTVISHFPLSKPVPNYRDIDLGGKYHIFVEHLSMDQMHSDVRLQVIGNTILAKHFANVSCETGLSSPALQNFLKTEEHFDVMITEFFITDCFLGLVEKVKAPIIGLSTCAMFHWTAERLGNPTHTAYIPNNQLNYTDHMSFFERLQNTVVGMFHEIYYENIILSRDEEVAKKYLGEEASRIRDFVKNTSLLITNTHFSLNLPRPLVPNVVEVGGLHIGETQPLPKVAENPK